MRIAFVLSLASLVACGAPTATIPSSSSNEVPDASAAVDSGATTCTLQANTSPSGKTSPSGCALLTRDTSACRAEREAAGLSGFWLKFSCRVTLTVSGDAVVVATDGLPDHTSNYFKPTDPCHEDYAGAIQNPNWIAAKSFSIPIAKSPDASGAGQANGVVGVAIDGVTMFSNIAAPGDDIYVEARTFDRCGAHPTPTSVYHYHSEPYAISYDDDAFIGVVRDGYPLYGRRDPDGSLPTLDVYGGHTGVTADSPDAPVYHYHVNEQTSTAPSSVGEKQWFLVTGKFRGSMPSCATCM